MINRNLQSINKKLEARSRASFEGEPWHGKSLMAILGIKDGELPERALALLNHMIAWRDYVANILSGQEYAIELNTPEDWPPVTLTTSETLAVLAASQERLLSVIAVFDAERWHERLKGAKYTYLVLCEGVIDHDIYHSAQLVYHLRDQA